MAVLGLKAEIRCLKNGRAYFENEGPVVEEQAVKIGGKGWRQILAVESSHGRSRKGRACAFAGKSYNPSYHRYSIHTLVRLNS